MWNLKRKSNRASLAFTLIELMVVLGMIGILLGAAVTGLGQAQNRARIAKANVEVRELINAWLSYEAANDDWPVDFNKEEFSAKEGVDATAASLKELLGKGSDQNVYLNVQVGRGAFLDPWGTPYRFRLISEAENSANAVQETFSASITFPNRQRYAR